MSLRAAIIDDEPAARALLMEMLSAMSDVEVVGVHGDVSSLLTCLAAERPHVLFVDIRLSRESGFDLAVALEATPGDRPAIVFVTAYEEHALRAFDVGAADYVVKPVDPGRLRRSVERVLARETAVRAFGDISIDRAAHAVFRAGHAVQLRPLEYRLLMALVDRAGAVVPRDVLLREVWGYNPDVASRTLDMHVSELRRKLEHDPAAPRHIVTVRTVGYRLDP